MKILALQKHIVVISRKQLTHIKGGSDNRDLTDIIVITDDDII